MEKTEPAADWETGNWEMDWETDWERIGKRTMGTDRETDRERMEKRECVGTCTEQDENA
jgi:hypothetical protein